MSEYASVLAGLATSVSSGQVDYYGIYEMLMGCYHLESVRSVYEDFGIYWNALVEEDAARVLCGSEPRFFQDHFTIADNYRMVRGIAIIDHERRGLMHVSEIAPIVRRNWDRHRRQYEAYGVTTAQLEAGYACFREQNYFYQQPEWKDRAAVARYHAGYKCELCKRRNVKLHAHHRTPIVSAWHHNFVLNFAWWELEALCEDCHRREHERTIRSERGYQFVYVDKHEVTTERQKLRKLNELHDSLKQCPFCHGGNAEYYTVE